MSETFLKSDFAEPEAVKEKTALEYYLAKAKYYAELGRDVWLVDGLTGEKRFFRNFDQETRKIASAFYKLGLRKGDVVIYMMNDLIKVQILLNGVWRANGIVRASYPDDDADTVLFRVRESNVKFIVCEEEGVDLCKSVSERAQVNLNIITPRRNKLGLLSLDQFLEEDDGSALPELLITENDPALILCTSGTTGFAKAALHTHGGLLYQTRCLERLPFTLEKPNLVSSKATHNTGTIFALLLLGCGKAGVVVSNITTENIFKTIEKYKPGLVFAFPTFIVAMSGTEGAGYDFSSLEVTMTGGVPITTAMKNAALSSAFLPNVKDFVVLFGLTELLNCASNAVLQHDDKRDTPSLRGWCKYSYSYTCLKDTPDFSVGKLYQGTKLQIRDPESLKVLGPNQHGEVCVWSKGLFHSYLNNPKATTEAHVDGYFRTGDIGYFDKNGYVYFVDRLKEIFKYNMNHISPTEIENVLAKHPKVLEAGVIGVADAGGHVPRAFVTIRPDTGDVKEIAEDIKQFANANLASYKHLRGGLYIVDELPKGKSGKITRRLLENIPLPC